MQISMKAEYALRALAAIGKNKNENPLSIKDISINHNLPQKFLEQLFRNLRKSNLVQSSRGIKGGYILTKETKEITMKDIITAVDKKFLKMTCDKSKQEDFCEGYPCGVYEVWEDIRKNVLKYLQTITLFDVMEKIDKKTQEK